MKIIIILILMVPDDIILVLEWLQEKRGSEHVTCVWNVLIWVQSISLRLVLRKDVSFIVWAILNFPNLWVSLVHYTDTAFMDLYAH